MSSHDNDPRESATLTVGEIINLMEKIAPTELKESWDSVGLICGDPADPVRQILLAVDPVEAVADEAITMGADLIITHHPLYLRGTNQVSTLDPKGKVTHKLIRNGIALFNAHTNLDAADGGVAQALADVVGLKNTFPLQAQAEHPKEGIGRVGDLPAPITLRSLASQVAAKLPDSVPGLLVSGDLDAVVTTMAVSGGAGDSLLGDARKAGVDVFLTADLRHHPASEHAEGGKPYLLCGTHWATEWVGLSPLAQRLESAAEQLGRSLSTTVSTLVTDPWTIRVPTGPLSASSLPDRDLEADATTYIR